MLSSSTMKSGASAGESCNIITWQQVCGVENSATVFPSIDKIYSCKRDILENKSNLVVPDCDTSLYEMHDRKIIYLLTQHSLWNRRFHPFCCENVILEKVL